MTLDFENFCENLVLAGQKIRWALVLSLIRIITQGINENKIISFYNDKSEKNWNFALEAKKTFSKAFFRFSHLTFNFRDLNLINFDLPPPPSFFSTDIIITDWCFTCRKLILWVF